MFWIGRLNSVLALVAFAGLIVVWTTGGVQAALGWLFVMFLVKVAFRILNTVWTAATGNPLFYDMKILDRDER